MNDTIRIVICGVVLVLLVVLFALGGFADKKKKDEEDCPFFVKREDKKIEGGHKDGK